MNPHFFTALFLIIIDAYFIPCLGYPVVHTLQRFKFSNASRNKLRRLCLGILILIY